MMREPEQLPGYEQPDRVPELTHYKDEGCVVWRACLSCPLPQCIYDQPNRRGHHERLRDLVIEQLFHAGEPAQSLAERYGLTRRSIFRIVRRERGPRRAEPGSGG